MCVIGLIPSYLIDTGRRSRSYDNGGGVNPVSGISKADFATLTQSACQSTFSPALVPPTSNPGFSGYNTILVDTVRNIVYAAYVVRLVT